MGFTDLHSVMLSLYSLCKGSRSEPSKRNREASRGADSQASKRRRPLDERRDRDWRVREERRDTRYRREKEERDRREKWDREDRSSEHQLGLARVLTLDSHAEQVDRFVQILNDRSSANPTRRDFKSRRDEIDSFLKKVQAADRHTSSRLRVP